MARYDAKTTASELAADLAAEIKDKVILVTGPSPGSIGSAFVEAVSTAHPALIILAARSPAKVEPVAKRAAEAGVKTRTLRLDLGSQADVRRAAAEVNSWEDVPAIDVLVNNAGIMAVPYALSPEGYESQFATNHLGHFLLTNLLMAKMLKSDKPRVVSVASDGHRMQAMRFDDLNFDGGKTYNKWRAYGQAKTANMLFALSLAEKLGTRNLLAFSLHPGVIFSNLANHLDLQQDFAEMRALDRAQGNKDGWDDQFNLKTLDQGAATEVYAAFSPDIKEHNGAFLQDCGVADPWTQTVRPWATSPIEAEKLWKVSEKAVGQEFSY